MKVALFVPCFIDAFYPEVGIATLELLERFGLEVDYPQEQTCCGQPMANSGAQKEAAGAERVFARNFADYDYVVGPSASCIHHVREHLTAIEQTADVQQGARERLRTRRISARRARRRASFRGPNFRIAWACTIVAARSGI